MMGAEKSLCTCNGPRIVGSRFNFSFFPREKFFFGFGCVGGPAGGGGSARSTPPPPMMVGPAVGQLKSK